jgi:hypothetical protein
MNLITTLWNSHPLTEQYWNQELPKLEIRMKFLINHVWSWCVDLQYSWSSQCIDVIWLWSSTLDPFELRMFSSGTLLKIKNMSTIFNSSNISYYRKLPKIFPKAKNSHISATNNDSLNKECLKLAMNDVWSCLYSESKTDCALYI